MIYYGDCFKIGPMLGLVLSPSALSVCLSRPSKIKSCWRLKKAGKNEGENVDVLEVSAIKFTLNLNFSFNSTLDHLIGDRFGQSI